MNILSHRGLWTDINEKNTEAAFRRSFESNFGTETDIRDYKGEIVIAHDPPLGHEMKLTEFLDILGSRNLPLALNIKSDGLQLPLRKIIEKFNISNYFLFDMSLPDQAQYCRNNFKVFSGVSDLNISAPLHLPFEGIWLDSFYGDWFGPHFVRDWLDKGKKVCIVSPELHKRTHDWQWKMLKENALSKENNLYLCTDFPQEAQEFFQGKIND